MEKLLNGLKQSIRHALVRKAAFDKVFPKIVKTTPFSEQKISTPEALNMPFREEASILKRSKYYTPAAFSAVVHNLYYSTHYNVIISQDRRIILDSDNTILETGDDYYYWRNLFLTTPEKKIEGYCAIFRSCANNYYHTVIDNLPRIYLLANSRYISQPVKLLIPGTIQPFEKYYLDKLLPESVTIHPIEKDRLYSVSNLIFNQFYSRSLSGALPKQYLKWFLGITAPNRPRRKVHRIYISRKKTDERRVIENEEELFSRLQPLGFTKHYLELMSIPEQIGLFYDAEIVIGAHGAGLTNLIFSWQVKVLELHPEPRIFPHYYFLCKSLGHEYHYVCGEASHRHSSFTIDINMALNQLMLMGA